MQRQLAAVVSPSGVARRSCCLHALLGRQLSGPTNTPSAPTSRFSPRPKQRGVVFKDDGQAKPGLQIFKDHGYNWIRLRLFHTPDRAAQRSRLHDRPGEGRPSSCGFKFLLNFHYSDTWADPQKQFIPAAWEGMSHEELERGRLRVHARHDRRLPRSRRDARHGADRQRSDRRHALARRPAAEELGQLRRPARRPASAASTRAASDGGARPLIMIHIDRGGDRGATESFFDQLPRARRRVRRDRPVVLSLVARQPRRPARQPGLHGRTSTRRTSSSSRSPTTGGRPSIATSPGPFPETPEGQRQFLDEVDRDRSRHAARPRQRHLLVGAGRAARPDRQPRHVRRRRQRPAGDHRVRPAPIQRC